MRVSRQSELELCAEWWSTEIDRMHELPAFVERYVRRRYSKTGQWPTHEQVQRVVAREFRGGDMGGAVTLVNIAVADESVRLRTALLGGRRRVTVTARCRVCA